MTTPKAGTWQALLGEFAPDLFQKVTGFQETVLVEGALSIKTKTLMMMLCDALLAHPDGVANIGKRARDLGASNAEIAETLAVAFMMGGLPGIVTGANAFRN
jgi:alkylhydroperoxidase/carboxymuconolactone decarboxylase family protein YurZ